MAYDSQPNKLIQLNQPSKPNQLNQPIKTLTHEMKILTIVTVVFVPLSLLVGIYGMNFEYMPELKSHNGYFILLSAMAGIVALLLYVFRRMRWL